MNRLVKSKFTSLALLCILSLVYIYGYNLQNRLGTPYSVINEPVSFTAFFEYFIANGLLRFSVPLLFLMGGYIFASQDNLPHEQRVKKRLHTLLIPYLVWSAIGLLITGLLQQCEPLQSAIVTALKPREYKTMDEYTLGDVLWRWLIYPLPLQLWIIRCLFVYILMYPLLRTALNFRIISFSILAFLWAISFDAVFIEGEGFLFFTLGIWFYKTRFKIDALPRRLKIMPVLIAWLVVAALKTWLAFKGHTGLPDPKILLLMLHKITIALGVITAWYAFDPVLKGLAGRRWFACAAFAFFIYLLHAPLITYATNLVLAYPPNTPYYRLLTFVLLPVIVILFCLFTGIILRKAAPKVYGFLTGGRLS
jgi:fucose 4-O-acetylase-like acetyltransferase